MRHVPWACGAPDVQRLTLSLSRTLTRRTGGAAHPVAAHGDRAFARRGGDVAPVPLGVAVAVGAAGLRRGGIGARAVGPRGRALARVASGAADAVGRVARPDVAPAGGGSHSSEWVPAVRSPGLRGEGRGARARAGAGCRTSPRRRCFGPSSSGHRPCRRTWRNRPGRTCTSCTWCLGCKGETMVLGPVRGRRSQPNPSPLPAGDRAKNSWAPQPTDETIGTSSGASRGSECHRCSGSRTPSSRRRVRANRCNRYTTRHSRCPRRFDRRPRRCRS